MQRLIRLHRPFYIRSFQDKRYEYSRTTALYAARQIALGHRKLVKMGCKRKCGYPFYPFYPVYPFYPFCPFCPFYPLYPCYPSYPFYRSDHIGTTLYTVIAL
jgi:hypothetical protein